MSKFSVHNRDVEIPLQGMEFVRFLHAAACGVYEKSTCPCRRLITMT